MKESTEILIIATQEQALSTRSIKAGVNHTRQDSRFRLCNPVIIQHSIVYRNICAENQLEVPRSKRNPATIPSSSQVPGGGPEPEE